MPTFQVYSLARYKKCKTNIPYPGNATQAKSRKSKRDTWRGTLIHALEKRLIERERERERERKPLRKG